MLEDAKLSWDRGDHVLTKHLIESVKNEKIPTFVPIIALGMYGEYLAETRAESTKTIIESHLRQSIQDSKTFKRNMASLRDKDYYQPPEIVNKLHLENEKRNYRAIAKCK